MSKTTVSVKINSKLIREAEKTISDGVHSDMQYLIEVALASYLAQLRVENAKALTE